MYAPHRTTPHQTAWGKILYRTDENNSQIRPRPKHKSCVVFLCFKWVEYIVLAR